MQLYPLVFDLNGMGQPYLWGGRRLTKYGKPGIDGQPLAEVWEVADRPEEGKESGIANGPLAGHTLGWLTRHYGRDLLGYQPENDRFPILVKFLDAADRLSIQVHPPEDVAARLGGEPKTEAWVGVGSGVGLVFAGFTRTVSEAEVRTAIAEQSLVELLHRLPFGRDDALLVPAGRAHGINADCLILEVQQASNTTFRLWDYGRVDPRTNRPRPLHVEEALTSLNFNDVRPQLAVSVLADQGEDWQREELVSSHLFRIERVRTKGQRVIYRSAGACQIVVNAMFLPLQVVAAGIELILPELGICLIPASVDSYELGGSVQGLNGSTKYLVIKVL